MSYNPISIDDEDVGNDFTSGLPSNRRDNTNKSNTENSAGVVADSSNKGANNTDNDNDNNSFENGSHVVVEPLESDKHAYNIYRAKEKMPHSLRGRNGLSADAYNKTNLLTSKTPLGVAVRKCLQHYYFEYNWQVAFPRLPESPLLYYPEVYNDLLFNPASVEVMEADIDAMSEGVLERIPLTYYPFYAEELHSFRKAAMDVEHNIKMLQEEAMRNGELERLTWEPEEVNHDLHAEDLELLDTDFDQSLLLQRDLPSLTLLQRPLYTDMGLVPQEQRHAERLARIVPHELRHFAASSASSVLRDLPSSPMSPSNTLGVAAMKYGREHDLHDRASTTTTTTTITNTNTNTNTVNSVLNLPHMVSEHNETSSSGGSARAKHTVESETDEQQVWQREVQRSFRIAKEIDRQFNFFIADLVHSKLGLCQSNSAHVALARALWRALQSCYSMKQQRQVWHVLCKFSSSYGERTHEEDVTHFMNAMSRLALPEWISTWHPLLRRYVGLLAEYITSTNINNPNTNNEKNKADSVAERKKQLRFSDSELDELYSGPFNPDLTAGKLIQRSGNEIGENKAALPIYPVEVMPIYPDRFDHAAARGPTLEMVESGVFDFLAERAEELRHVVLPGALVSSSARNGPHVLVSGTNLLVADSANNSANWEIGPGAAISYHTSKENTFESLLIDDLNTSSYLFQIMERQGNTLKSDNNNNNNVGNKSDAVMTSTINVQSAVRSQDTDTASKQDDNNKDTEQNEGNMPVDKVEHKVAAIDDGSGSKPTRRSGNMQHLTINTNLDNISTQGQTHVDVEVSATDDALVAPCVFSDGASNMDGRYCIYDRIGMKASFVKANTIRAPPATRYVIVFDEDENIDEVDRHENESNNDNNNCKSVTIKGNDIDNKENKTSVQQDGDNAIEISSNANSGNTSNQKHALKRERNEHEHNRNDNATELVNDSSETQEKMEHVSRRARNE